VLRRVLLAASASPRLRQIVTTAPATRAIVDSYVAGETADDAVRVTRALRAAGLLVSLDYLGEDTKDEAQATAVTQEYMQLLGKLAAEGLTHGGAAEVSVKPTAVGLGLAEHGEKTAAENVARICAAARSAGTRGARPARPPRLHPPRRRHRPHRHPAGELDEAPSR